MLDPRNPSPLAAAGLARMLILSLLLAASAAAQSDKTVVTRTDGTKVIGDVVEETFDFVTIQLSSGEKVKIAADDIDTVVYPDIDRSADGALEDAGGEKAGTDRKPRPKLSHEKEWPRQPETDLEKKVWALGPLVRYDESETAAKELAAIRAEGYTELFKELLLFDYALIPEAEDNIESLWRRTLATEIATSGDKSAEDLGRDLAKTDDARKRLDATYILRHFPGKSNAKILHDLFVSAVEPISSLTRPDIKDILIANEEQFNEVIDNLDAAYDRQPGLCGAAEDALRDMGAVGIEGVGSNLTPLDGEEKRASIYLVGRLSDITVADRKKYGYRDDDVAEIGLASAKILIPPLGRDDECLPDYFFGIMKLGEPAILPLIDCLKRSDQKRWAGVALRRLTKQNLPTNYQRWRAWYKERYGK